MCFEAQLDPSLLTSEGTEDPSSWTRTRLKGKSKEGIDILGMVTLSDLDKMHHEGKTGRGWIACTTDAIFLEKPSYYDLVIDLTTSRTSRPTLYLFKPIQNPSVKGPTHRLSPVRYTWSDVKLVIAYTTDAEGIKSPERKRPRSSRRTNKVEHESVESSSSGSEQTGKALRKVSLDEFWERMSFRQECIAGAVQASLSWLYHSRSQRHLHVAKFRHSLHCLDRFLYR